MKKVLAVLVSAVIAVSAASAMDFGNFGGGIEKGDVLLSPGFGFGKSYETGYSTNLLGGTLAADFALPAAALTVGLESGFLSATYDTFGTKGGYGVIPILARVGYHPDLGVKNLDVYALAKIGFGIGFFTGDLKDWADDYNVSNPKGLVYGFDIGVRYFFAKHIGVFAEGGYEYYFLKYKENGYTYGDFAKKFIAAGVTFKL
jgi:hypothetical protein